MTRRTIAELRSQGIGDRAILDALDLIEQRQLPCLVPSSWFVAHWGCDQSNASRRLAACHRSGLLRVVNRRGQYRLTAGAIAPLTAEQAPADWLARREQAQKRANAAAVEALGLAPEQPPAPLSVAPDLPPPPPAPEEPSEPLSRLLPGDVVRSRDGAFYSVELGPRPGVVLLVPVGARKGLAMDWPARSVEGLSLVRRHGQGEALFRAG